MQERSWLRVSSFVFSSLGPPLWPPLWPLLWPPLWPPKYFGSELACGNGRRVAGVAGHVVDHLFDLFESQPVVQRDLEVELQFVAGPQGDECAEGYQAARSTIQARPAPQRTE